jgi:hypothetical protein
MLPPLINVLAGDDRAPGQRERRQQPELGPGERDLVAATQDAALGDPDRQPTQLDHGRRVGVGGPGTAQQCADAGGQLTPSSCCWIVRESSG